MPLIIALCVIYVACRLIIEAIQRAQLKDWDKKHNNNLKR